MKKNTKLVFILAALFLNTTIVSAQQDAKIQEYSKIIDQIVNGAEMTYELVSKMSKISTEINCQLTKKQAEECKLVNFASLRAPSCGSADFPEKGVYTSKDIVLYNNAINKLTKYSAPK
jgi:hypothetical protein